MAFRLGSIEPFDAGTGDWSTYKARLEQFLVANDVEGEPKQVATVLTLIGGPTYGLLVNLLAPESGHIRKRYGDWREYLVVR